MYLCASTLSPPGAFSLDLFGLYISRQKRLEFIFFLDPVEGTETNDIDPDLALFLLYKGKVYESAI